ncbi:MAG: SGNH/GDSL hydrolase family protein, partial [Gammaproteobacteria bacterium]
MKFSALICAALYATSGAPAHATFSDLYVFGDSLSDNGNAFIALSGMTINPPFTELSPTAAYASKRLSNGPI